MVHPVLLSNKAYFLRILKECDGSVELIDASPLVPGLKFQPGLNTWVVGNKENVRRVSRNILFSYYNTI